MADKKEQPTADEHSYATGGGLIRQPSIASTVLPAYQPTDQGPSKEAPPSYEKATTSASASTPAQAARSPRPAQKPTASNGSCGMPASMISGVMGPPPPPRPKESWKARGKRILKTESMPQPRETNSITSGRWNVQGSTLSDFGSFKKGR